MDLGTGIGLAISGTAALSSLIASLRNGQKIQDVHLTMNSRLDELLAATKAQAFAEGRVGRRYFDACHAGLSARRRRDCYSHRGRRFRQLAPPVPLPCGS